MTLAGSGNNGNNPPGPRPNNGSPFPPVLKDENPSDVIMKYMDGLAKRSGKVIDTCYERFSLTFSVFHFELGTVLLKKTCCYLIQPMATKELKAKYEGIPDGEKNDQHKQQL